MSFSVVSSAACLSFCSHNQLHNQLHLFHGALLPVELTPCLPAFLDGICLQILSWSIGIHPASLIASHSVCHTLAWIFPFYAPGHLVIIITYLISASFLKISTMHKLKSPTCSKAVVLGNFNLMCATLILTPSVCLLSLLFLFHSQPQICNNHVPANKEQS